LGRVYLTAETSDGQAELVILDADTLERLGAVPVPADLALYAPGYAAAPAVSGQPGWAGRGLVGDRCTLTEFIGMSH